MLTGASDGNRNNMNAICSYGGFLEAWCEHHRTVVRLIETHDARHVCEVGGGANPSLGLDYIRARGVEYTVLDISQEELDKAPGGYRKLRADICGDLPLGLGGFDLVFTKMLCEHVRDARRFHQNVLRLLSPKGIAFHFFPTLFSPPFVLNRLLPEKISQELLDTFRPRDGRKQGKFPAYYAWCRGPTRFQIARLQALGYEIVAYRGFFGHTYYSKIPLLGTLARRLGDFLVAHPLPHLTSYAYLVMRRARPASAV